jgi:Flp pilus assembly protein TadG
MRRTERRRRERGAALGELALVMPFLLLVVMLMLEGSRLVETYQIINNAAREGARLAVLPENQGSPADIAGEIVNYAGLNGVTIPAANITIDQSLLVPTPSGVSISASQVTVQYSFTLNYLAVFTLLGVPGTYTLSSTAEFRNFY